MAWVLLSIAGIFEIAFALGPTRRPLCQRPEAKPQAEAHR
jgi:hypothetical protein